MLYITAGIIPISCKFRPNIVDTSWMQVIVFFHLISKCKKHSQYHVTEDDLAEIMSRSLLHAKKVYYNMHIWKQICYWTSLYDILRATDGVWFAIQSHWDDIGLSGSDYRKSLLGRNIFGEFGRWQSKPADSLTAGLMWIFLLPNIASDICWETI